MKLYHGSPNKLKLLIPRQAKGCSKFENLNAVFLTKTFLHAALYAIGKTLKGKTAFGVSEKKLVIVGKQKPKSGYVYEVNVIKPIKGPRGQYACTKEIVPMKITKVFLKNYEKYIVRVDDKNKIIIELKKK